MQAQENRPPYVEFETRAVEDREASIEAGSYKTKDVTYALITPQGSKDKIEKEVEAWLADIRKAAQEDRFPSQWVEAYEHKYSKFKEGAEVPLDGTPILGWQLLSPANQKNVIAANIRTVEDLATANESALVGIGMGARGMKEKAISWLEAAKDTGKVAAENEALRKRDEEKDKVISDLQDQLKSLAKKVEKLEKEPA